MTFKRIGLITVSVLCYCALALASLVDIPVIGWVIEGLPRSLVVMAMSAVGPATLFAAGINAWPVFAAVLTLIAVCLGLARFTSWKFPEDEWSAFWLLCAVLVWAGSPWLLVIYGI